MYVNNQLVSVIMNCYNGERYLKSSIESVLNQSYSNWELIFWDNCSSDNSASIAKSYLDKRIKYFKSDKFTSLGEARNLALKNVSGSYIAFIDSDDIWLSNKIKKQLPLFKNKNTGIVISNTIFFKNNGWEKILYRSKPSTGYVFNELLIRYFISLETVIIRKECLDTLDNWFDNRFNLIEEFDFLCRISHLWELDYVDEVLAKWRLRKDSMTWIHRSDFPKERNLMINKFKSKIPNFEKNYKREIEIFNQNTIYEESLGQFMKKNYSKSRYIISPFKFSRIKYFIFYILTFLPFLLEAYYRKKGNIL
jgi:glycosyltransferase involved in cell wall biosynthesis